MTEESRPTVEVMLRIPGCWRNLNELMERLPSGYEIINDQLQLPDQTKIELFPIPADKQFASVFRTSLRSPANPEELEIVDQYTFKVGLAGPGGSLDSARTMMNAAAAIMLAGGAGVFIDNSCLSHGAEEWLHMTEEGSSDAISFG